MKIKANTMRLRPKSYAKNQWNKKLVLWKD
jgi:hypothetical protein